MSDTSQLIKKIYHMMGRVYYDLGMEIEKNINLSERDVYYLGIIYRNQPLKLSEFAQISRVSKPAATQIVNRFLDKDYVTKVNSSKDRRVSFISLSPDMLHYFQESEQVLDKVFESLVENLTPQEHESAQAILTKMLTSERKLND
ncbi:MarR family winged helix-turn-helix transcriptional regulator [Streptococcus saliviloxodontae]|uniref:DNA-binding MarR family transcriptional regulator n=1 Tax=Streptococcus saliviloxodontae TaxID=1349416 RepID=A0ABS2PML1_9STRE|nr:MarR family transcriptional regulator [Streptococcus saliviloxodontae]MBM7636043.1 DNA-binding MarR family transcriptional regulator [Streptococcus saliviloxodontae]